MVSISDWDKDMMKAYDVFGDELDAWINEYLDDGYYDPNDEEFSGNIIHDMMINLLDDYMRADAAGDIDNVIIASEKMELMARADMPEMIRALAESVMYSRAYWEAECDRE